MPETSENWSDRVNWGVDYVHQTYEIYLFNMCEPKIGEMK